MAINFHTFSGEKIRIKSHTRQMHLLLDKSEKKLNQLIE
jgi:hypothetical protein